MLLLRMIKDFVKCTHPDNCSWCGKEVGVLNLIRIWYTETADDVCKTCYNEKG